MAILARVDTRTGTNKPWSGGGGSLSKRGSLRVRMSLRATPMTCGTPTRGYTSTSPLMNVATCRNNKPELSETEPVSLSAWKKRSEETKSPRRAGQDRS